MKQILLFSIIFISSLLFISCQSNKTKRVILIGIDGLSTDGIQCAKTPNLNRLIKDGAFTLKARGVMPTVSAPNWGSMLCGAGPEQHGITNNGWTTRNHTIEPTTADKDGYFPSMFTVIRNQRPDAKTAIFYDWKELMDLFNGKYISKVRFDSDYRDVYKNAIKYVLDDSPLFTFIYAGIVDEAGHKFAHGSPEYYKSIEDVDSEVGKLLNALDSAGLYETTNFIVVSDHGGVGYGHGGESMAEIQVPWIIEGPGIIKNKLISQPVNTYYTASTIAYLLGLHQPDEWIGVPVLGAFTENSISKSNENSYLPKPNPSIESGIFTESEKLSFFVDDKAAQIRYTIDGSDPNENSTLYSKPLNLDTTVTIKAISVKDDNKSELSTVNFIKVLKVKSALLINKPSPKYPAEFNGNSLIDHQSGNEDFHNSAWMGFEAEDFVAVIDLGKIQLIKGVTLSCLDNKNSWIYLPSEINYFISNDNRKFENIGSLESDEIKSFLIGNRTLIGKNFENVNARYLKVIAKNINQCPAEDPGAGGKAWLFVDEVMVQ
ncbi:MAG: alkaline phosphatase family protein [Ignavibacteriaceae bacterium]